MTLSKLIFPQGVFTIPKIHFKLIKKLRAGYKFKLENNRIKISRYFNPVDLFSKKLSDKYKKISPSEREKILNDKISSAVSSKLFSDTPIGVCFSGGVDNISILLLFKKKKNLRYIPISPEELKK